MNQIIAISKRFKDVTTATNPNDFIFHSSYNTFKIIKTGIKTINVIGNTDGQVTYHQHGCSFTPLVTAFAKETGVEQVFLPNSTNVSLWGRKLGWTTTGIKFVSVESDSKRIIFTFDNSSSTKIVYVRYFVLEGI